MSIVFVVGRVMEYPGWELVGIYNYQKQAQEVCVTEDMFVGPVKMNRPVYDGRRKCPSPDRMLKDHGHSGAYFPVKEWQADPDSIFGNQPSSA